MVSCRASYPFRGFWLALEQLDAQHVVLDIGALLADTVVWAFYWKETLDLLQDLALRNRFRVHSRKKITTRPRPIQPQTIPRHRRPRHPRPRRDRLGQDRRLRDSDGAAHPGRPRRPRADSLADARDHAADEGLPRLLRRQPPAAQRLAHRRPQHQAPDGRAGQASPASSWPLPAGCSIISSAAPCSSTRSRSGARRSRPHARHGLHAADPRRSWKLPAKRQTLMFSATMPPEIAELAEAMLTTPSAWPSRRGLDRGAHHAARHPGRTSAKLGAAGAASEAGPSSTARWSLPAPSTAPTRWSKTAGAGRHSGRSHSRQQVAEPPRARRLRSAAASIRVLVATDIAARGIDVDGISHVINFDLPNDPGNLRAPHRPHRARRRRGVAISLIGVPRDGLSARYRAADPHHAAAGDRRRPAAVTLRRRTVAAPAKHRAARSAPRAHTPGPRIQRGINSGT